MLAETTLEPTRCALLLKPIFIAGSWGLSLGPHPPCRTLGVGRTAVCVTALHNVRFHVPEKA